ncbi:hypothetical protein C1646_819425 [Rhizophagus diaphanus]|nr:hypothetical protein C1646_819425 [Rhizophagus diaphanus] [Rhizophagus sp. MUCL 43196]
MTLLTNLNNSLPAHYNLIDKNVDEDRNIEVRNFDDLIDNKQKSLYNKKVRNSDNGNELYSKKEESSDNTITDDPNNETSNSTN